MVKGFIGLKDFLDGQWNTTNTQTRVYDNIFKIIPSHCENFPGLESYLTLMGLSLS
jgi:hypothetical protein